MKVGFPSRELCSHINWHQCFLSTRSRRLLCSDLIISNTHAKCHIHRLFQPHRGRSVPSTSVPSNQGHTTRFYLLADFLGGDSICDPFLFSGDRGTTAERSSASDSGSSLISCTISSGDELRDLNALLRLLSHNECQHGLSHECVQRLQGDAKLAYAFSTPSMICTSLYVTGTSGGRASSSTSCIRTSLICVSAWPFTF